MRPWHADLLSDGERARRGGLWDAGQRAQFTVAAALLRLVAAPLTGQPAERVVVDRSCPSCGRHHGRPRLPGTGLDVSISHSGATVAVAVSSAGAVGVDVQQVADDSVHELSPLVLAESEAGHVAVARDFFTYWTRKEALVKATGDGVAVPLSEVVVTPPGTPPRPARLPSGRAGSPRSSATSAPTPGTSAPSPCSAPGPWSSTSGPRSGC